MLERYVEFDTATPLLKIGTIWHSAHSLLSATHKFKHLGNVS
jgi:hypothetical protein